MAAPEGVDSATWAALLSWSMKQTSTGGSETGDGTAPSEFKQMSKEDRDWLENVMKEGIVDLVKRAGEIIDSLKADCIVPSREKRPIEKQDELLDLLDELQDICEQIDFAMSLCQIGGLPPLLEICHPGSNVADDLRGAVLGVIATVAQNNPFTQNALMNLNALPLIMNIAASSSTTTSVRLKALHAVSCIVRNFQPLETMFYSGQYPTRSHFSDQGVYLDVAVETAVETLNGPEALNLFLAAPEIKIRRKASFLLGALITNDSLSIEILNGYFDGCVEDLVGLVSPVSVIEGDEGLEVDLREITLRNLVCFAGKGKGSAMMEVYGDVLNQSKASAVTRINSGNGVENAQAELELWNSLFRAIGV